MRHRKQGRQLDLPHFCAGMPCDLCRFLHTPDGLLLCFFIVMGVGEHDARSYRGADTGYRGITGEHCGYARKMVEIARMQANGVKRW